MTASGSGRSPMRNARSPPSTPRYRPPLLDLGAEPPVLLDHLRRRPFVTLAPVGLVGGSSSATPPDARFSCRASCAITGFGSDPRYSRTARSRSTIGYFLVAATENFLPPGTQDQTWLGSLRKSGETHRPRTSRFVGHRAPPNRGKLRATVRPPARAMSGPQDRQPSKRPRGHQYRVTHPGRPLTRRAQNLDIARTGCSTHRGDG
jgi:hypothetical protein